MAPAAISSQMSSHAHGLDRRKESIEERCFAAALICLEAHYGNMPTMGPLTNAKISSMISKTLEKTHNFKEVREALAKNVSVWIWLTRIFAAAIPNLTIRSVGPLSSLNDPDNGVTPQESTGLIIKNYAGLKEDLQLLNKLMHVARNMLVTPEPEIAQDLCAAVQFDQMVYQTIILCVNVTSKGYDGEVIDDNSRAKLNEVADLYKKLLVTSLQQAHNWTAKNDRNKMSFWYNVLFDEESAADDQDGGNLAEFRTNVAKTEVRHWLERNSRMCEKARLLLHEYHQNQSHRPPGKLAPISPLAWNWLPEGLVEVRADDPTANTRIIPSWKDDEPDKFTQDQMYGRVSREVDTWWLRVRDPNYDAWVVPMPSVDFAHQRTENCKANLSHRYACYRGDEHDEEDEEDEDDQEDVEEESPSGRHEDDGHSHDHSHGHHHDHHHGHHVDHDQTHAGPALRPPPVPPNGDQPHDNRTYVHDYVDDMAEEEDMDDDESYGEGPMTGLLTDVPNILDPKQIEALHMIIKSCILDTAGMGLTRAGENLQKTRCRMFLALDCGKSLLREMLVFIAVWEKEEQSLIFQITTQIIEAIHHSALVPYAWQSLRIPKDIISPAQTILLRLIDHMFRARVAKPPPTESKETMRDIKLLHFLFIQFRSRIVPECIALMSLQEEIRNGKCDPADFPVDNWDMERAKDGLQQFLEFLATVCEAADTRAYLITWEATYELLALLKALDTGVPKKPLVDLPDRSANRPAAPAANPPPLAPYHGEDWEQNPSADHPPPPPPPPPVQDPAYKFAWTGIKGPILQILAELLQPPPGKTGPGNPDVQKQIVQHNGIVHLLNCCVYDDHNRFARERVQICLKWLMDGSEAANAFLRNLVHSTPPPNLRPPPPPPPGASSTSTAPQTTSLRVDGIAGEIRVQLRSSGAAGPASAGTTSTNTTITLPPLASATFLRNPEVAQLLTGSGQESNTLAPIHLGEVQLGPVQIGDLASLAAAAPTQATRARSEELLRDIINLADEAARLALGPAADAEETEDEEFM